MELIIEETIDQYEGLFQAEDKRNYFINSMMKPFESMWKTINVPLRAKEEGGYDVLMAAQMLGFLDVHDSQVAMQALHRFKRAKSLHIAKNSLNRCLQYIRRHKIKIDARELRFGLYIADPDRLRLQRGYTGFGGIPGFIQIIMYPDDYTLPRLPAIIAHEFHHNIRFSYFDWDHGNITVADYLVIEGLAESFAQELYGKELLGPWVTSFSKEMLNYFKDLLKKALDVKGFAEVTSYMFGDEIASREGYQPVGLPPFAGYAVGYEVVQAFLKNNKLNIMEASLLSSDEIIKNSGFFN